MNESPLVSVLLPVYNEECYIQESMESIFMQTYSNFEVILVDDGSTDGSAQILETYVKKDSRIRLIRNSHDFIGSLNLGLSECHGKYIARMDADDKMKPERLTAQVEVMESFPDIAFCSSFMQSMGSEDIYNFGFSGNIEYPAITLLLGNVIFHPTVILRNKMLQEYKLQYSKGYDYAEDYKLWSDIALIGGRLFIIPKPLIEYRVSESQVSYVQHEEQYNSALKIKNELLQTLLRQEGMRENKDLFDLYHLLSNMNENNLLTPEEIFMLFNRILMRLERE